MKKFILILFLINSIFNYGQVKTGVVLYKVTLNKEIPLPENPTGISVDLNKIIMESDSESEKITYTLVFSPNESYFYANPMLVGKDNFNFLAGSNNGAKIKYYQNKTTQEYREYVDSKRLGVQILNTKVLSEWTLTKDTKIIDGYKCYKATSPSITSTGKKNDNSKFDITAWYCPELPIQEGPVGYGGLPGLILELQFYKAMFTASKIDLNPKELPEIDRLSSPKAISEETYNEMFMSTLNREQYDAVKKTETKENTK